ncbi:MAG TPA: helix-turn-helix transcriptional regulator [Pyrinomonadaceae bacterium]|nr:helix-turn-helix transcriptional regulator [Pyrinomonadaceae bacterium]
MVITTRIKELAEKRGITNAYQLQKAAELPPSMAARLFKDEVDMIALRTISTLCRALKCKPGELFKYEADEIK